MRAEVTRTANQIEAPHAHFPMRKMLPYGRYNCADGSYVLFNRDYQPLFRIQPDGTHSVCKLTDWIQHHSEEWFYDETNPPWESRSVLNACVEQLPH